ncbi:2-oxoacid:acceptor oxidoreductase family protein [Pelosinus baikalensis]|uniref:2-oxoacid:acceptor oxidoreductase family protein n=1 Tax=Pelosinus baikalensis TaxID=2892015 RepID=A0ABS8HRV6_9FIRM|nr:2-oxoacid:acceptor oxidoreductase family protein [Pelosinus baikalensis]MCC5465805.1 2-oxoacid:acceptor oxidoreductase family protein [Pelosinus baikalensis]
MPDIKMDIYIIGVGGQGIGLLSEVIIRAADYAGFPVRGTDTHGLAQRGGTVSSCVRIGSHAHSALIRTGCADMVIALEKNEALRGLNSHLRDGGTLIYYDTQWQPLLVRLKKECLLKSEDISAECQCRNILEYQIAPTKLSNPKMQNIALLASIAKHNKIPGITPLHYELALKDLLEGNKLEHNLSLFRSLIAAL